MASSIDTKTFRLIVGLGNPGPNYALTRHNIGFMVLDHLAKRLGFSFRTEAKWHCDFASHEGVYFVKPTTFMNLSGQSLRAVADFYRIPAEQTLAVFDDAALPLGKLRWRENGSAGGHNGMQSLIDHAGTNAIPRLKIGIDAAEKGTLSGHVLSRFSAEEMPKVQETIVRAADAIEFAQAKSLPQAMNQFN